MRIFPAHATDFYKTGHRVQYPPGTEFVYSNFTCRSDHHASVLPDFDHKTVFFGLQGVCQWMLIDWWNREFFERDRDEVVARFQRRMDSSLGTGTVDGEWIGRLHDKGFLPVIIKALPEGSRVNIRVPVFTIMNTDPEFAALTNYLETQLSAEMWKSITSATSAFEYRRLFERFAKETGAPEWFIPWQGHDFSMRGQSGIYDATSSGAAHLLSFTGTDTISAIDYLEDYYGAGGLIGGSVPASEHSVMTLGGEVGEIETFRHLFSIYPTGVVSIVSDSWDYWRVMTEFATELKGEIMARDGKCVFRPDSGDPVKIIVGDPEAPDGSPEQKGSVECLWDIFGGTTTGTGHRLLDSHVGLIYGDSITLDRAVRILEGLKAKGFSSGNIVFGIGSFTYQFVSRDTYGCAVKATYGVVNGVGRNIYKDPKTDDGVKKSARGLLRIGHDGENFVLHECQTPEEEKEGLLEIVFCDGKLVRFEDLDTIRLRLLSDL